MTVAEPNWFTITGLIFSLYGVYLLADACAAGSRGAGADADRQIEAACRQRAGIWFALPILGIGFAFQMAGQFASTGLTAPIVIALLALGFALLTFAMVADLAASHMAAPAVSETKETDSIPRPLQVYNGPVVAVETPRRIAATA